MKRGEPMYTGWTQVAFSRELENEPHPVVIDGTRLMLIRRPGGLQAFDATCPHRGANLAYGGQLTGDGTVVCPFHGRHIHLGREASHPYSVAAHPTVETGGGVFVLLDQKHENGFESYLTALAGSHYFIPGFSLDARITPDFVIENVFDADHFHTVHGLSRRPDLQVTDGESGELLVRAVFHTARTNKWQSEEASDDPGEARFLARVFSPTLVATELGTGDSYNVVITAATPTAGGGCTIRVTVAMAPLPDGSSPTVMAASSLMSGSRTAFEQDMVIWEHLDPDAPVHFAPSDAPVQSFREFCRRFEAGSLSPSSG